MNHSAPQSAHRSDQSGGGGVVEALSAALGSGAVRAGADLPERNGQDWGHLAPQPPLAVVRPDSPEAVAAAMEICHRFGVAAVPQGGLTGLCGGARPVKESVAISLERLTGVLEIDPAASTMTVYAGTPLQTIQQAADAAGLFFALDLGARGSCTIGGNLSTNAGGNRVIRYGMTRDLVLGLQVVLPDGTLVTSLNKMLKNNAGYDLKQLFIGSEGTLGVITTVVLRLHPKPACTMAALCGLTDFAAVLRLLDSARRRLGPLLSAFEVMWPDYWQVATRETPNVRDPIQSPDHPDGHGFYVLVEAQGMDEAIDGDRFQVWLESQIEAEVLENAAVAQSLADINAFWGTRDACAEFYQVLGPHISFDIGLPVAGMDTFASACRQRLSDAFPGCRSLFYGHIGDGNMHIVVVVPGRNPQPAEEIEDLVYDLVRDHKGTVSAEHGIGLTKKPYLPYTRTPEELALMGRIKRALDPEGLLNPGKVVDAG